MWTYKGIDVYRADMNGSGIRWDARSPWGLLRADTKVSMRDLINHELTFHNLTSFSYSRR